MSKLLLVEGLPLIVLLSIISLANCLHLAQVRNLPETLDASNNTKLLNDSAGDAGATSVKNINLGTITSALNPTQIINQLQSTVNKFLQTLNNTLSGSSINITSLLGTLTNITNKSRGSFRLEDADLIVANITELVKESTRSAMESLNNSTAHFETQVHGAFEDFHKAFMELRNSAGDEEPHSEDSHVMLERRSGNGTDNVEPDESSQNGSKSRRPNGLPLTLLNQISSLRTQVDSSIQRSLLNARSSVENSLEIARQNSQNMRNQTSVFMGQIQRVFDEFSAPFRNFFEALRRGRPTAVVAA